MEHVCEGPEQVGQIVLEPGAAEQIGEGVDRARDRALGGVQRGQGPRVGVVLEGPAAIEREFVERVNGGGGDWAGVIIRVGRDGWESM